MNRTAMLIATSIVLIFLSLGTSAWAGVAPCNEDFTVGGGQLGTSNRNGTPIGPPDSLGFDVGSGQCNGSFTVSKDASFPSADGDGIELGLRAEARRQGQITNTSNNGDYGVETGPDPTQANRAFWNIQHSIAYDGNINELDSLTWIIRTDAGPSSQWAV